ncbi:hypothetical protein [Mucilaginibacter pedocola]|uniref:Uncharacterized protein n=1 Tax=Mucilaginibacter pedocola TaxID=1792845 RepID=A0A1S9PCM5_9SPHI|nr:hypothetical protein [Mucilaginibacter pedocola]OOQ58689.1 hypothetical protein BC343_08465 [Mucilaginibacter pedocola]
MKDLLADSLHIFIIIMIAAFIIGGILALTGTFDHWGSRYVLKRRRKRLMRNRRSEIRKTNATQEVPNTKPYYAPRPERNTNPNGYNSRYA